MNYLGYYSEKRRPSEKFKRVVKNGSDSVGLNKGESINTFHTSSLALQKEQVLLQDITLCIVMKKWKGFIHTVPNP